jgi:3-hydroxyisobutyrate dehydrogenase-like beta-hydroxyacid dehydrogenase
MAVTDRACKVAFIGLGVMGRSLAYNMAAHTYGPASQAGVFHAEWGEA